MKKYSAKSYTRVTLALDIIRKISDGEYQGFHELNTIKHLISLHDIITVEESPEMKIECTSANVPTNETNTCWKICDLVKQKFDISSNVKITIDKRIPVQGGLAGGSANAATTLSLLADMWQLDITLNEMIALSRIAGQDIPFYFAGPTAFDTEAGLVLDHIENKLRFDIILVTPTFGVSTKDAYSSLNYDVIAKNTNKTQNLRQALATNNRQDVVTNIHNDFELTVFDRYPALSQIKQRLLDNGCVSASLTGSGSTMIGILESANDFARIKNKIGHPSLLVSSAHGTRFANRLQKGIVQKETVFAEKRTDSFRWHSKQELCNYFEKQFGYNKNIVDAEINEVMKTFKIRNGQAILTLELWQKVGLNLEKKMSNRTPS